MKNLLFLFVFINAFAFGQNDIWLDLSFHVLDQSENVPYANVMLSDETGKTVFDDYTDEKGRADAGSMQLFSGKEYCITVTAPGFHMYRKTTRFQPMCDACSRRLIIDIPLECKKQGADSNDLEFDLTVRVSPTRDRTQFLPDVLVTVLQGDNIIFRDCSDANGKIYLDTSYIKPNSDYKVLVSADGFHQDRNGSRFTTKGLGYDQNFVIDIGLMEPFRCLFFYPSYDPSWQEVKLARYDVAVTAVEMQRLVQEREDVRITGLAVYTSCDTTDSDRLIQEARALQKYLRKHLPGFTVDKEIRRNFDDGFYRSAVGVMWLFEEREEPSQSNTK